MREVVIVEGCRTAVGRRKGAFSNYRADDLFAEVLKEVVKRAGINKSEVEDVIAGCVTQVNEQAMNVARTAALIAGFPITVPGVTIDRQCGSSQQAVHFAAQAIASGDMDIVIAGGVESMTRSPMFANVGETKPSKRLLEKHHIVNQGISAEMIADQWGFLRQDLDEFSLKSHTLALQAIDRGYYRDEIVPVKVEDEDGEIHTIIQDEGPRRETTIEILGDLQPVFKENGKITAGNASQMSDGASAVLLMSREKADEIGVTPIAKITARTVVGSDPTLMLTGPIEATRKVLEKAQLTLEDIDRYEVNEAFAPVPLAWLHDLKADPSKLNVNGGAIALGHPLGATGTKLLVSLLHELERINGKYGLLAICEGMGMANATVIERIT
ncbi:thiolase family protein [Pseudogracilibacillus auburnensis]|uniref:Acetyl-CoA acetyltransferase family protein n=1 Tax=Pseudogracilibacillus auburnensis TaxID=1494959 RepID=A0A2V3VGQ3_9BACI|nr:thiolase family protein [Pseudogracilibacillus auburnensis]PXW80354.1 acetyl-CoA acetyltransferase family protein [Pseudogracilibacillus auburnensis]